MARNKLNKLKRQLLQLGRSPQKAADLEAFATRLGRTKRAKRGKEPVWQSTVFPLFPVSIPHHGGRDLTPGTRDSILAQLETDIIAWERKFDIDEEE